MVDRQPEDPRVKYNPPQGEPPPPLRPIPGVMSDVVQAPFQAPPMDTGRPAHRELRDEATAWRPLSVYVGTLTAGATNYDIGIGSPMFDGALLRRAILRLRSKHELNADNYWTMGMFLINPSGTRERIPGVTKQTINQDFPADINFDAYHESGGLRVNANYEVIVRFSSTGSPADLTQVQLYADWFVGI